MSNRLLSKQCGTARDGRCGKQQYDFYILRVLAGSIMCGAYAFILFVDMHWIMALISKLVFSAIIVLAVFGYETRMKFMKAIATFYIVSFLMGGITIALMYMTNAPGMSANGSVYLYGITYLQIMLGILATAIAGIWLSDYLKEKNGKEAVFADVEIYIDGEGWKFKGLVDTGNFLKEPITGHPVALVSKSAGEQIMSVLKNENLIEATKNVAGREIYVNENYDNELRYCVVPYKTVGRKGVLNGIKPEYILVKGKMLREVVIAFAGNDFKPWRGIERYDVLLHENMME